jgi:putative heme-binding domain-containing protein
VKTPANPIVRLDPQPDGNFKRTLVAEGFDDPVMGMVIRNGQLWAAANNYLFRFDLTEAGLATNKTTLLVDKNKAWNPFGMFVLEWGPEGDLYMSVGNHNIDIGPEGQKNGEGISGRGGSGIVLRMKPDGTQLERLVHGLRVPYAFDIDPFGQHWQLSNGEGNPNRFVRVIEGVDYHCYSRPQVNNEWLAGRHPLAPPSFELPRGATTQLLRYYGANFPASYQGSLFLDNWGAHGFGGPNRTIFRYVPDARNNIETKEEFLVCRDPHFRCSHVLYAPDGSLLIADWYGRDDESDLTGRVWRVSYTGEGKPAVKHKLDAAQWKDEAYALSALGSPDHGIRTKAMEALAARGNAVIAPLSLVTKSGESLAAAHALWTLARIQTPESIAALASGSEHADWRVRRQTLQLLKRYQSSALEAVCRALSQDADPAVRVMAASLLTQPTEKRTALIAALTAGAAADDHLRYEAAWHLADVADAATYKQLLASQDEKLQHAGLIAIDIAGYEKRSSVDAAMQVLAEVLASPRELDQKLVLDLARLHDSPSLVDALRDLVRREDVPPAVTATALLMLRSKSADAALDRGAIARFLEAVKKGEVPVNSPTDQLTLLDLLESEGPTEFTIARLQTGISHNDKRVQEKAHRLARKFGTEAAALAPAVWNRLANPQQKNVDEKLELLTTLLAIQREPQVARWTELLRTAEGPLLVDIVRSWRQLGAQPELAAAMIEMTPKLLERNPSLQGDLPAVVAAWPTANDAQAKLKLAALPESVEAYKTAALSAKSANEAQWLGRRVFERTGCVKCHTALSQNTERAPSLQGIGKAQKIEYLMESILEPSTVIKTGYETETIVTKDGKVHAGLVKEQGDQLRIITADGETTIPKSDIDERAVQKKSLMPDGQHRLLSPGEFADLIVYLKSL